MLSVVAFDVAIAVTIGCSWRILEKFACKSGDGMSAASSVAWKVQWRSGDDEKRVGSCENTFSIIEDEGTVSAVCKQGVVVFCFSGVGDFIPIR